MQHLRILCAHCSFEHAWKSVLREQDTLIGFEALAAYALNEKNRFIYQMDITVESTYAPDWSHEVNFTSENFAQVHHIQVCPGALEVGQCQNSAAVHVQDSLN